MIACLSLSLLIAMTICAQSCTASIDCNTNSSVFAYCAPQNYCLCNNGYVLNCTNTASPLSYGTSSILAIPRNTNYYTLASSTSSTLDYTITLTDNALLNPWEDYGIGILIDDGPGSLKNTPNGYFYINGASIQMVFQVTLGNMPGTSQPQQLILVIVNNNLIPGNITISYSSSTPSSSTNVMLIVGYVAGGLLLGVTIFMMVAIYRKRGEVRQVVVQNNEPRLQDISHFNALMPIACISPQDKKDARICSVCLQEFQLSSTVRITVCGHMFHVQCIDQWCIKNLICPMCRTELSQTNIISLRGQQTRRQHNSSWVMNTMEDQIQEEENEEETAKQIRRPLYNHEINPLSRSIGNAQL